MNFNFDKIQFITFSFMIHMFCILRSFAKPEVAKILFCKIVVGLMFRPMTILIFEDYVRYEYIFILFHIYTCMFQHYLRKIILLSIKIA